MTKKQFNRISNRVQESFEEQRVMFLNIDFNAVVEFLETNEFSYRVDDDLPTAGTSSAARKDHRLVDIAFDDEPGALDEYGPEAQLYVISRR